MGRIQLCPLEGLLDPPLDKTALEDVRQELAAKDIELPGQGRREGQGEGFGRKNAGRHPARRVRARKTPAGTAFVASFSGVRDS